MRPANSDPVECARSIVYAHMTSVTSKADDRAVRTFGGTSLAQRRRSARIGKRQLSVRVVPPYIAVTEVCILSAIAFNLWCIATR